MDDTVKCPDCCLEGGCRDFAFAVRVAFASLGTPEGVLLKLTDRVSRRFPMSVGMLMISSRSKMCVGIIPGPTLLRGGRAAGFGGACEENWLWRRVRMDMLLGGWGIEGVLAPDAGMPPLAFLAADWLKRRAKELLRAGRVWPGVPVKVGMVFVLAMLMLAWLLL